MVVYLVTREGEDFHELLGIFLEMDTANKFAATFKDDVWGRIYIGSHGVVTV